MKPILPAIDLWDSRRSLIKPALNSLQQQINLNLVDCDSLVFKKDIVANLVANGGYVYKPKLIKDEKSIK